MTQGQETALSAIQWWVDDHRHRDRGDDDGHGEELDPGGGSLYLLRIVRRMADVTTYRSYRQDVARALMLGLEILVAADIIRTVALAPTLQNVLILGLLVVIRTFLSWGLVVEIEERWPWQLPRVERTARAEPKDKE